MSFESVLLLLFLVVPLLERLIRFLRARAGEASAEPVPDAQERPAPVRRPTAPDALGEQTERPGEAMRPKPPPPVPAPVLLPPRHPAAERLRASDRVRAGRMTPASDAARPRVQRDSTAGRRELLRGGTADLRRAVMLMTILGPCKALESGPGRG